MASKERNFGNDGKAYCGFSTRPGWRLSSSASISKPKSTVNEVPFPRHALDWEDDFRAAPMESSCTIIHFRRQGSVRRGNKTLLRTKICTLVDDVLTLLAILTGGNRKCVQDKGV